MSDRKVTRDEPTRRGITRRGFLTTSAGAAAGLAAGLAGCARKVERVAPLPPPPASAPDAPSDLPAPERRTLGRTGLRVSAFGLGGGGARPDVFTRALNARVNFIHCSLSYGTLPQVAEAIADRRDEVFVGLKYKADKQVDWAYLDRSLEALGTDYVDVLFFPLVTPEDARDRSYLEIFEQIKKQKKARFIGITTHSEVAPTMQAAVAAGFWDVLMPSYVPVEEARKALRPVLDQARKQNQGVVAMKTMVGIQHTATSQMQTALKQVLADSAVSTLVKGALNFEFLGALLQAASEPLTADESASLRQHLASRRGETCFLCGECPPCPRGVNVFEVVRAFDYYYTQAGRPDVARMMYGQIPPAARGSACDDCGKCVPKCPYGVNIARHVQAADLVLG